MKKIQIAGEKFLAWNIAVKDSTSVNCCEKFWVKKLKKKVKLVKNVNARSYYEKCWLEGGWKKTITAGENFK